MNLYQLKAAREALREKESALRQRIAADTANGVLIMRYGDLPEWQPYQHALDAFVDTAKALCDMLLEAPESTISTPRPPQQSGQDWRLERREA